MRKRTYPLIAILVGLLLPSAGHGQETPAYKKLQALLDSMTVVEAPVFAPKSYEKAKREYDQARQSVDLKRDPKTIDSYAKKGQEYCENALKAGEVARLSLKEYLPPRERARAAKAQELVPALYSKAEMQFTSAADKVELGDIKGGLREAARSSPLFDGAELEAIRVAILGKSESLIAQALIDEAPKYALSTLDKARTAHEKANTILTADRYNRKEAVAQASRAEYEARHASNIAQSVRSLARNDQAWEKLMLLYEIQMSRVGDAIGLEQLPYDNGPLAAADSLIAAIRRSQGKISSLEKTGAGQQSDYQQLLTELKQAAVRIDSNTTTDDPATLIRIIDSSFSNLRSRQQTLTTQMESERSKLTELSQAHEEVAKELQSRQEDEARLTTAKTMLNPTEGEVLFNSANDIVLRLSGLSFEVGKSDIVEAHLALLEKVKQIIELFPEARMIVEGHTDDRGEAVANTQLSEKRAFAVMQYLRQSLTLSAERIRAIGYGSEKPIGSNLTPEGRAKNRRIDIILQR